MDELSEPHSEENKASQEKNNKRQHKTPAQLNALEKFYDEHKYPTEEMKADLAVEIGLSEKQISGWFCHRRLKDKKLLKEEGRTNGRQDRSSRVIQNHEFRQDSCGSSKHGDYKHFDPREVESQGNSDYAFPATDRPYDRRSSHCANNVNGMNNTSSESSSYLQEKLYSDIQDPYDMRHARYLKDDGDWPPMISKRQMDMTYKPSGYLKVKGEIENAAITAVKKQLGRNYMKDGPLLSVEFDQLPPGAFESVAVNPVHESSDVRKPTGPNPSEIPQEKTRPSHSSRYEHDSKFNSHEPHMEGENLKHDSDFLEKKLHQHLKKRSSLSNHTDSFPGRNSFDRYEDSIRDASAYNGRRGHRLSSKNGNDGMRSDSGSNYGGHDDGEKVAIDQTELMQHVYDDPSKRMRSSEYLKRKPSNLMHRHHDLVDTEERGRYTWTEQDNFSGERKVNDALIKGRKCPTDEIKGEKQSRVALPPRDCIEQKRPAELPPLQKQRSALEMPSSFSEDETGETSCSLD